MARIAALDNPKAGDQVPLDTPSHERDPEQSNRLIEKRAVIHQKTHVREGVEAEIARLEAALSEQQALLAEFDE